MSSPIASDCQDTIFSQARTHMAWQNKPVSDDLLKHVYELAKWGPTSANGSPARFIFLKSKEAKERLKPALMPGNVDKTMAAPVTAIVSYDLDFYEHLPRLFPHANMKPHFAGKEAAIKDYVSRNGSLQGAYLMIAARALGLDCGPMSGFNNAKVDEEFFKGTTWRSNFLCNLGYGDASQLHPRGPRLTFDEACKIL
jgi:3-hydroxypropanoate dehydrogenase